MMNSTEALDLSESSVSEETGTGTGTSISQEISQVFDKIAEKETKQVFFLRLLVLVFLMATAMAVSVAVFAVTFNGDEANFKEHYEKAAQSILENVSQLTFDFGAITTMGISSQSNGRFAFVPNFRQRATTARSHLAGALSISIAPMILLDEIEAWDSFVNDPENGNWINDTMSYQKEKGINDFEDEDNIRKSRLTNHTVDPIHYFNENGYAILESSAPFYLPIWQTNPVLQTSFINENMLRWENNTSLSIEEVALLVLEQKSAVMSGFVVAPPGNVSSSNPKTAMFATLQSMEAGKEEEYHGDPNLNFHMPIYSTNDGAATSKQTVGLLTLMINWRLFFECNLPDDMEDIIIVLTNSCNEGSFTYEIRQSDVFYVAQGDHHDSDLDDWQRTGTFGKGALEDGTVSGIPIHRDGCTYRVDIYPTDALIEHYKTLTPVKLTMSIVTIFIMITFLFLFYDRLVERRQTVIQLQANKTKAIVSSLFPKNVRDRLLQEEAADNGKQGFARATLAKKEVDEVRVIADLFPHCTVFFADIAGFTAWSSTRDPAQVFILLQTIFQAFDHIAKRRKVFKVETIGDCYMAVTGLPEPQPNHALNITRFAWDCLLKMSEVTKSLEEILGPGTGELSLRIGLNSGPVTAGVLRGDRARFQLFGDTVNTASRIESTGSSGRIQVSESTAKLLMEHGKEQWLSPRKDPVEAKGKGSMKTFWVDRITTKKGSSVSSGNSSRDCIEEVATPTPSVKTDEIPKANKIIDASSARLVNWLVDLLLDDIKKIVHVRRETTNSNSAASKVQVDFEQLKRKIPVDELTDGIALPAFDSKIAACMDGYNNAEVDDVVVSELRLYISVIASLYRNNAFHNFEHACHVTMSVKKLLKRIICSISSPNDSQNDEEQKEKLYNDTYGINGDPLLMFATSISALVHDVDHQGVSNIQVEKEMPDLAAKYRNQSVAEQNSLDVAWDLFLQDEFQNLRSCIFASEAELVRFRQLTVNLVLATDVFDKDLIASRKSRWAKAFSDKPCSNSAEDSCCKRDLRATIVVEHIIQASDVSHTMQHWYVYQKWNKKLFEELMAGYRAGRLAKDPSTFWYQGELDFFDNYIIPLAKKLSECSVFGVSAHEYLDYALKNRAEWEQRGHEVVEKYMEAYR